MTFLNSALLAGLFAVALPLLIHLFSRRKFPKIDFSTLRFLRRLQRQQMRHLKLRQWLLLALRTLAVLLIVLAFARPALVGQMGFGALTAGRTGVVVVVDASAGMQARNASGSSFQQAKEAAQTLLSSLSPGDRAQVIVARREPETLADRPTADTDALRRALQEVRPWDGPADLAAALDLAARSLRSSPDFRGEIYLISDFAAQPELPDPPAGLVPFFVPAAPESPENLSAGPVRVISEIIEPGQPVEVEVTLANHGRRDREDVYYSLYLNGTRVAEDVVSLMAGGEVQRRHQVQPQTAGLQEGSVEIEDHDLLEVDDRAFFCFSIPEKLEVLLAGEAAAVRRLRLALAPSARQDDLITLREADAASWDAGSLAAHDVIILAGPASFTSAQAARLATYVENGGGLLLFPGSRTDAAAVNRELLDRLDAPRWGEPMGQVTGGDAFLVWADPDLDEPLLRGILRPGSKPTLPHFYQALRLVGDQGDAPLRFRNGLPFLAEAPRGQGRVILAASSPDPAWSDWGGRGIFAPLIHRLVLRLAGGYKERCQTLTAGQDLEIRATEGPFGGEASATAAAELITPEGQEIKLPPQVQGQRVVFRRAALEEAGVYRVRAGSREHRVAVNPPPEESDLKTADLPAAYPAWQEAGVIVAAPDHLAQAVRDARYGRELWKAALIAGLVFLGLELALGSAWKPRPPEGE
ncbi:MAG: VWA domain-containing protein [Candidatus Zixiibacteriota bacterium]|nr:MAG: VWA domain-containing protein [candidate division Zixibacteria bacterium]